MLSERCGSHRLRRGHKLRATLALLNMKNEHADLLGEPIVRSRSLESLDKEAATGRLDALDSSIRRSCDLLDGNNRHEVLVHREMNDEAQPNGSAANHRNEHSLEYDKYSASSKSGNRKVRDKRVQSVADRLGELLTKTNEIIQMEQMVRQKYKDRSAGKSRRMIKDRFDPVLDLDTSTFDDDLLKICHDFDKYNCIGDKKMATNQRNASISSSQSTSYRSIEPKLSTPDRKQRRPFDAGSGDDFRRATLESPRLNHGGAGFFQNTSFDPDLSSLSSNTIQSVKMNECAGAEGISTRFAAAGAQKDDINSNLFNEGRWSSDVLRRSLHFSSSFSMERPKGCEEPSDESECSDDDLSYPRHHNGESSVNVDEVDGRNESDERKPISISNRTSFGEYTKPSIAMQSSGRNRNPLSYTMNSDDEILADSQLPPLVMKNHIDDLDRTALTMQPPMSFHSQTGFREPIDHLSISHLPTVNTKFNRTVTTANNDNNVRKEFLIYNRVPISSETKDFMFAGNIGASSLV